MSAARPEVGAWYQTAEGVYLEVVAYDPEEDTIELQFYDGTVEEYDSESWEELELRAAEPPEDWSSASSPMRARQGLRKRGRSASGASG